MDTLYRNLRVDVINDVFFVRLDHARLEEGDLYEFGNELVSLVDERGCRKLVLSLGDPAPDCLYSMFLAKLMMVRRHLGDHGGSMILCEVSEDVRGIFTATSTESYFDFCPDKARAIAELATVKR